MNKVMFVEDVIRAVQAGQGIKRINVLYEPTKDSVVVERGCARFSPLLECDNPNCSIFNHSNGGVGSNLPEGFVEP